MNKNRGKRTQYITIFISGIFIIIIALNFGKIKFMFNMIRSSGDTVYDDSIDEDDNFEVVENPLFDVIEKENDNKKAKIIEKHNEHFELMKNDYEAKLDSLVKIGYEEYRSGDISAPTLANKLLKEGSQLEKQCDADFNEILKEMEKDLKDNDHATEIIKDLDQYYHSYKQSEKSKLMKKAKQRID